MHTEKICYFFKTKHFVLHTCMFITDELLKTAGRQNKKH